VKAVENAIWYLERIGNEGSQEIADDLKRLLPTPRKSRSEDDSYLDKAWKKFRDCNPGYWKAP